MFQLVVCTYKSSSILLEFVEVSALSYGFGERLASKQWLRVEDPRNTWLV